MWNEDENKKKTKNKIFLVTNERRTNNKGVKCVSRQFFWDFTTVLFARFFHSSLLSFVRSFSFFRRYLLLSPGMLSFLRHITQNHFIRQTLETHSHYLYSTCMFRCIKSKRRKTERTRKKKRTLTLIEILPLFFPPSISSHSYVVILNSALFLSIFKGAKMRKFFPSPSDNDRP